MNTLPKCFKRGVGADSCGTGLGLGLVLTLACAFGDAKAQSINFSQTPLYLQSTVKPNLLVIYDNSASMEYVMSPGTGSGATLADANTRGNIAREVLRTNITTYRNQFRWGLETFDTVGLFGPNLNYGFVPPITIAYYSAAATGRGAVVEDVTDDNTTHFNRLISLLGTESADLNSAEIKNGSYGTPLPGAINTAAQYFSNTLAGKTTPIAYSCQRSFVVVATDGDPTIRMDLGVYDAASQVNTLVGSTWTFGQAALDVHAQISALRNLTVTGTTSVNGTYDVQTYLIGLGDMVNNAGSVASMNRMAELGGTGSAYLAADRASVTAAFAKITSDIAARTSASSAVAATSGYVSTDTDMFQAKFNSGDWSGQLLAFRLDANTGQPQATPRWDAGARLNLQNWSTGRRILTYKPSAALGSRGVAFRWPANAAALTATDMDLAMVTALNTSNTGSVDGRGSQRLQYLRGDPSREARNCVGCSAPVFRNRSKSVLGDIINSSPVYVKNAQRYIRDSAEAAAYSAYNAARATMTPMVYAGANDGMLHAFNANTGDEVFAYVPALVADRLSPLTDPGYSHRYSVDGMPVVSDVYYGSAWHSALVSGLGAGAKGLFALDVSDPSKFTEATASSVVRWEISGSNSDVGHILQPPVIAKTPNGRWMAITGNGYNSSSNEATLLLVDIETGAVTRVRTKSGSSEHPNGLSAVAVVSSRNNGVADTVYAGDLNGDLWEFDLSSTTPSNWSVAYGSSENPRPLFSSASGQSITARPDVTPHPSGGYMVTFGTGRYMDVSDNGAGSTQTLYGIWDNGSAVNSRSQLVTQSVLGTNQGLDGRTYRFTTYAVGTPSGTAFSGDNVISSASYLSGKRGWMLDLPTSGERIVTPASVRYGKVVVSTLIPSTVPCSFGGDGWVMEVDAITGNRSGTPALDTDGNNLVNNADMLSLQASQAHVSGVRVGSIPTAPTFIRAKDRTLDDKLVNTSAGSVLKVREAGSSRKSGRAGWEQIQ